MKKYYFLLLILNISCDSPSTLPKYDEYMQKGYEIYKKVNQDSTLRNSICNGDSTFFNQFFKDTFPKNITFHYRNANKKSCDTYSGSLLKERNTLLPDYENSSWKWAIDKTGIKTELSVMPIFRVNKNTLDTLGDILCVKLCSKKNVVSELSIEILIPKK